VPDGQIVAMGGWDPAQDGALTDYVLGLVRRERPKICFIPTASAEDDWQIARFYEDFTPRGEPSVLRLFGVPRAGIRDFLLGQDVIWVSGGNTANMVAIWRVHGVDSALREAWESGAVLAGWSAGAVCWFEGGVTDSFGPALEPLDGCLGFLAGSFCPHYDSEPGRRPTYETLIGAGAVPDGYAADDGVGLHFAGTKLAVIVSARPGARAFRVRRSGDGVTETPLTARHAG
jgi:dipeptidase E